MALFVLAVIVFIIADITIRYIAKRVKEKKVHQESTIIYTAEQAFYSILVLLNCKINTILCSVIFTLRMIP